jgi:uncharacterized membrane protein HdeD (DUF308 family)
MEEKQNESEGSGDSFASAMEKNPLIGKPFRRLFGSKCSMILHGILIGLVGLLLIGHPGLTLLVLTTAIGAIIIISAIFVLSTAVGSTGKSRWFGWFFGSLSLLLGLVTIFRPLLVDFCWILMVAVWLLVIGVHLVSSDLHAGGGRWVLFFGVLSIACGIVFVVWPFAGLLTMIWVSGVMLVLLGGGLVVTGIRLPAKK